MMTSLHSHTSYIHVLLVTHDVMITSHNMSNTSHTCNGEYNIMYYAMMTSHTRCNGDKIIRCNDYIITQSVRLSLDVM